MNLPIADVIKNQNRYHLEIKNNAVCDVIDVLQRPLGLLIQNKIIKWLSFCNPCLPASTNFSMTLIAGHLSLHLSINA